MKYILACFLLVSFGCLYCHAQPHLLKTDRLSTDNGLPDNDVEDILQDNYGYIWLATARGMVRYDGYKTYLYRLPSSKGKHNSVLIFSVFKDAQGNIWACTSLGGIFRYDSATDKFIQYNHDENDPKSLPFTNVLEAVQGNGDDIWITSFLRAEAHHTQGLSLYDPKVNGFVNYGCTQKGIYHLDGKLINNVFKDDAGVIRLLTDTGLYQLNPATKHFDKIPGTDKINFKPFYRVYQNAAYPHVFWMYGFASGLLKLNIATKSYQLFKHTTDPNSLPDDTIKAFIVDKQRRMWVGNFGGLSLLDPKTGTFTKYPFNAKDVLKTNQSFIRYKYDGGDNIWLLGTAYLACFNVNTCSYKYYALDKDDEEGAYNSRYSMTIDRTGTPWIATGGTGVERFNALRTAFDYFKVTKGTATVNVFGFLQTSPDESYMVTTDGLYTLNLSNHSYSKITQVKTTAYLEGAMARGKNGLIALGMDGGVGFYDPAANSFKMIKNGTNGFKGEDSRKIIADRNGNFWIGTGDEGVTLFNAETGKFRPFPFNNTASPKNSNRKWLDAKAADCLYQDSKGAIWAGTYPGGLNRFNPKDSSFTSYFYDHPDMSDITSIYEDREHRFWVTTELNGLFLFDRQTGKVIKQYTESQGLLSDEVKGVIDDDKGRIWINSSLGLSVLDPATNKVLNYTKANALPDNEIREPYPLPGGRVLYTTSRGVLSFNFDDIKGSPYPPPVYIETLLHNDPASATGKVDTVITLANKQAVLPYNQNQVTFNIVALQYNDADQNKYEYRLEGFDNKWISTKTQRSVAYSNLSPGTYTFKVKAASGDGVWNNKGDQFVLTITPPLWLRWWAWLLYVAAFIMALRAYLQYRSRRLLKENHLLEEKIATRTSELSRANAELSEQREEILAQRDQVAGTLKELEQTQNQLIQSAKMASMGELTAGIAHEIQNPLNFVNNFSEVSAELVGELQDELAKGDTEEAGFIAADIKQNLEKINHHGKRADGIVKAMLQHSRTSSDVKELTDINKLTDEYLRLAYHGLRAKDKTFNAELLTSYDQELPQLMIMPQDIGRVLLNIFNNAFYAVQQKQKTAGAEYKPTIEIATYAQPSAQGGWVLKVRDNGTGIPDSIRDKILQPFFTTKPTGEGTGLGLSLSYDIVVKSHGGQLIIDSIEGEHTEFTIELPPGK